MPPPASTPAPITEGFLAALGPRFLAQLYRRVARGPDAFLLVAEGRTAEGRTADGGDGDDGDDGDGAVRPPLAGFLAGALDLRALYRRFALRHGLAAALPSLPRLVGALPQVWETVRHGAGPAADTAGAELLSVAVDPAWQGRHVGALLVTGSWTSSTAAGVPPPRSSWVPTTPRPSPCTTGPDSRPSARSSCTAARHRSSCGGPG